jgi:hypothetical protein
MRLSYLLFSFDWSLRHAQIAGCSVHKSRASFRCTNPTANEGHKMSEVSLIKFTEEHKDAAKALVPLVKASNEQDFVSGAMGLFGTMATGNGILGGLIDAGAARILATSSYFALQKAVEEDAAAFETEQQADATLRAIGDVVEAAVAKVLNDEKMYEQLNRDDDREFSRRYGKFEEKYPKLFADIERLRNGEDAPLANVRIQLLEMRENATFIKRALGAGTQGMVFDFDTIRMDGDSVFFDDSGDASGKR